MKANALLLIGTLSLLVPHAGATTTFSFITDTWTNGSNTQVGYLNEATSGTLTKGGLTMEFQASFAGSGIAASRSPC